MEIKISTFPTLDMKVHLNVYFRLIIKSVMAHGSIMPLPDDYFSTNYVIRIY
jgi:hypothetical protein